MAAHFAVVLLLIIASLGVGVAGYVFLEGFRAADAFLHSAMLLGGLGLVQVPSGIGAKLFAGIYALYSGLVFLAALGIILAPVIHRIPHKLHWDDGVDAD